MQILESLLKEYGADILLKANKFLIPAHNLGNHEIAAEQFNQCYQQILNEKWNLIKRTPSKSISIAKANFNPPMYDVIARDTGIELTVIGYGKMLRIQFRQIEQDGIYGRIALKEFKKVLKKFKIDLDKYTISNGLEIKKEIPKYIIAADRDFIGYELENCHHLDFHSSFPAGLANTHPEFRPALEYIYKKRKESPMMKAVLNASIGMFHSIKETKACWAHLAKDAIQNSNDRITAITQTLLDNDRTPILWNTDGVWYKGEIYHGEGEGSGLGQWENDHVNCKLRIKSRGAYEFIENDKYYPVIRGLTKLDKVKPRAEWEWGDIFRKDAETIIWEWKDGVGIINTKGDINNG